MIDIVKANIEQRERNNVKRNDFIQCLIQLRNTGKISDNDDNLWKSETVSSDFKSMSIEQCAAQVFLFYSAGFHTSASAVTYALYELAANPELMHRLQKDIDEALERHNNELTYECMQDIPFLELCVLGKFMCGLYGRGTFSILLFLFRQRQCVDIQRYQC